MFSSRKFSFIRQVDSADCGTACLSMITRFFGARYSLEYLNELTNKSRIGINFRSLSNAAQKLGLNANAVRIGIDGFSEETLPCILHWNNNHFVVLYKVKKGKHQHIFFIADPAFKKYRISKSAFEKSFIKTNTNTGFAMFFSKASSFEPNLKAHKNWSIANHTLRYLQSNSSKFMQLIGLMILTNIITLIIPYTTQLIVDKAIKYQNKKLLLFLFFAQVVLFLGDSILTFYRSWVTTYISGKIGLALIQDFLKKMFKLPMYFFETKSYGDLAQRIQDHSRLEHFLTSDLVNTLFSMTSICIYSFIIWMYGMSIFLIFLSSIVLGIIWLYVFQAPRKNVEHQQFQKQVESQNKLHEIIGGIQEVKLFAVEEQQQKSWLQTQRENVGLTMKSTKLDMYQSLGFGVFQHGKNIIITFIAANMVMDNLLTFGELLSLSFVLSQTNQPLNQLLTFAQSYQDAKLSMHRLWSIQSLQEEVTTNANGVISGNIEFDNVTFYYPGQSKPTIFQLNLCIEKGKTTAIVGESGSGKTSILRLILGYYANYEGQISIGDQSLKTISPNDMRAMISTVLQNSYIFDQSFLYNITMEDSDCIDRVNLDRAIEIANLRSFIDSNLRGDLEIKIGKNGLQLSGGQIQRVLIARAIYKRASYFLFDEATSALDTENETKIIQNLHNHFKEQTVILVAHRLSTVKKADTIVVMEQGQLVEQGTHEELLLRKGKYYHLVKNQLDQLA